MPPTTAPTGVERRFGSSEVIVTKTDTKGRITYANNVFCRISALSESSLLGRPHNVIRHPAMPRGVYRLMWETIAAGEEMFAYVVNLAHDGAHYWVHAHVTPSYDRAGTLVGYHSNRRLPDPEAVRRVEPIYRRMLQEESRHDQATAAATAGADLLQGMLAEQGTTYDRFVWSLTDGTSG